MTGDGARDELLIKTVCVAGCGVMGRQVAWACANAGMRTVLFDRDRETALAAARQIARWMDEDGKPAHARGAVVVADDLRSAIIDADLVFENIFEDAAIKKSLYREIEDIDGGRILIGSNASSLSWTKLSEELRWPQRFFLMNFSGPRHSPFAEYMDGPATARDVRDMALSWAQRMDIIAVPVLKDSPGYAQNRIWRAIKKESLRLVDQGYSTPDDVDRGFILSFGTAHGPFAIMDMVGLHTVLRVEQRYHDMSGDPSDSPPAVLVNLVANGHLGVSTGAGFYEYPNPRYEREGWLKGIDSLEHRAKA